ncbi:hypothetical protein [Nonomuraea sp. NPDC049758]|uniref:hypothetical protein n=1 Tax=Nonomuraea sp. NPDC049758 TaxID=3154360 RepID=UPI0034179C06
MTSRFFIGEGYASYQGPSADNSLHRPAAVISAGSTPSALGCVSRTPSASCTTRNASRIDAVRCHP